MGVEPGDGSTPSPAAVGELVRWLEEWAGGDSWRVGGEDLRDWLNDGPGDFAVLSPVEVVARAGQIQDRAGRFAIISSPSSTEDVRNLMVETHRALAAFDVVVVGGFVVLHSTRTGIHQPSTADIVDDVLGSLRLVQGLDARSALSASTQAAEAIEAVRSREAAERDRLRRAHLRDVRKIHESTRYLIGSWLVSAALNPRSILQLPRKVWHLWKRRARSAPLEIEALEVSAPARDLRVGAVLDEFSWSCFAYEARLVELEPGETESLDPTAIDLVLVESAWRGNRGRWNYEINRFAERSPNHLADLLAWCRDRDVPAVFWNKEDPVNYEVFIDAAREFPAIATTDADLIDTYRRDVGHDRVIALPFAAQPALHNPIGSRRSVRSVACFAGAWRGDKYEGRRSDFGLILDPLLRPNLVEIYDRYANDPQRDELGFPEPYRSRVVGSLPYSAMVDAYRRYAVFLNVNSVVDSPTMFSRRVFEILACGTPVISTWSRGIDELLGEHVIVPRTPDDTMEAVEMLTQDVEERERRGHLGYRHVHLNHTYTDRFDDILDLVGLAHQKAGTPKVSVIAVTNRPQQLEHIIESYERQTYENVELVLVGNSAEFDPEVVSARLDAVPEARAMFIDESATLADCLNEAISASDSDYIAKFDDDDYYGAEYLRDMILTFAYSGAAVAGKRSYYAYMEEIDATVLRFPGREFSYENAVVGGTLVLDRRATADLSFTPVQRGTDSIFLEDCRAAGLRVFSADRYNFVQHRSADVSRHTWQIDSAQFLERTVRVSAGFARDRIFI